VSTNKRAGIREDLAYRFHHVYVPPLAARGADIPALVQHFATANGIERVTERFVYFAAAYPWPGNVRQLRRLIAEARISGILDIPFDLSARRLREVIYRGLSMTSDETSAEAGQDDFRRRAEVEHRANKLLRSRGTIRRHRAERRVDSATKRARGAGMGPAVNRP
jgi:DNA-binding NtrC family response regulator